MQLLILYAVVTAFFAVANFPFLFVLLARKETTMPLDFTKLNAAVADIAADAAALQAQAAASGDAVNQTNLDAAGAALATAHAAFQELLPAPAAPVVEEPAPVVEQPQ